jgi:hypothetical protein
MHGNSLRSPDRVRAPKDGLKMEPRARVLARNHNPTVDLTSSATALLQRLEFKRQVLQQMQLSNNSSRT